MDEASEQGRRMATARPAAGRWRVTTRRARCWRRFAELTPNNNSVPHTGHFSNFRTPPTLNLGDCDFNCTFHEL